MAGKRPLLYVVVVPEWSRLSLMPPRRCPVMRAANAWPSSWVTVASSPKYRQDPLGRDKAVATRMTSISSMAVTCGDGDCENPDRIRCHSEPATSVMLSGPTVPPAWSMQYGVQGRASSLPSAMGAPQISQ